MGVKKEIKRKKQIKKKKKNELNYLYAFINSFFLLFLKRWEKKKFDFLLSLCRVFRKENFFFYRTEEENRRSHIYEKFYFNTHSLNWVNKNKIRFPLVGFLFLFVVVFFFTFCAFYFVIHILLLIMLKQTIYLARTTTRKSQNSRKSNKIKKNFSLVVRFALLKGIFFVSLILLICEKKRKFFLRK